MRKTLLFLLFPFVLLLTGCDDQARSFAKQTKAILMQRSAQISKEIAAEVKAYNEVAALSAQDHHTIAVDSLQNERAARAYTLAADYADGRKPASLWRNDLSAYAEFDYETNKPLLYADLDAETSFLKKYQSLAIEQSKVDALAKLLDALSKNASLKDQVTALSGFVSDTQKAFDQKLCASLQSKGDAASKKLATDMKCNTPKS